MDSILSIILCIIGGFFAYVAFWAWRYLRSPKNNPVQYLNSLGKGRPAAPRRVVFIGDSITHGHVQVDYVKIVADRLNSQSGQPPAVDCINAGINSEMVYNVLKRIDPIIQCNPDAATLLIGTNDAYNALLPHKQKRSVKLRHLPEMPTEETFRRYLTEVLEQLKARTRAKIALLTLPTLSEDPADPGFVQSGKYSDIIKEVAARAGVPCLPLFDQMVSHLASHPHQQKAPFSHFLRLIAKSLLLHALGRSWDAIARSNGLLLHTDQIHLNSTGAQMVADLVTAFLKESL